MSLRIGIQRCLLYYPFYPFWKKFFNELGIETVVSSPMSTNTFDKWNRRFVGDICLPIETLFSHVESLKDQVDVMFVPRSNNVHTDSYVCPACAGLPYIILRTMKDMPGFLTISLTPFRFPDKKDIAALKDMGFKKRQIKSAYSSAVKAYDTFIEDSRDEPHIDKAILRATSNEPAKAAGSDKTGPRILLLGMPYVLGDSFVNQGIPQMLEDRNCQLITPFMIAPELANKEVTIENYPIYWPFAGMGVSALSDLLNENKIDGVVYCSSFACGVDSMIIPIVQSVCSRCYKIPFTLLVVDEHAESSHIELRIEAFLDCMDRELFPEQKVI